MGRILSHFKASEIFPGCRSEVDVPDMEGFSFEIEPEFRVVPYSAFEFFQNLGDHMYGLRRVAVFDIPSYDRGAKREDPMAGVGITGDLSLGIDKAHVDSQIAKHCIDDLREELPSGEVDQAGLHMFALRLYPGWCPDGAGCDIMLFRIASDSFFQGT